jgi:hypothetical protein
MAAGTRSAGACETRCGAKRMEHGRGGEPLGARGRETRTGAGAQGPRARGHRRGRRGGVGRGAGTRGRGVGAEPPGGHDGEEEGGAQGRGKGRGRGRERGRGELTSGSKSGDHRLQYLGHCHGERERWEREGGCCAGEIK